MKDKPNPAQKTSASAEPLRKRIFLVDDHPMMRDGMSRLIDSEPSLTCCGGAKTAEEALSEIPRSEPDLVITDITLPNRSGLDLIKDLVAMTRGSSSSSIRCTTRCFTPSGRSGPARVVIS